MEWVLLSFIVFILLMLGFTAFLMRHGQKLIERNEKMDIQDYKKQPP